MKLIIKISIFFLFVLAFASCAKYPPLEKNDVVSTVANKSVDSGIVVSEDELITDPENEDDIEVKEVITDPENEDDIEEIN